MDIFEEARALATTMKMRNLSQKDLAKSLGVSPSYVSNKLRLLILSKDIQQQITNSNLTERHVRAILRLKSDEDIVKAINEADKRGLTVAETEALVDILHYTEIPLVIKNSDRINAVEIMDKCTRDMSKTLNSLGINARQKTSFIERKRIITICIDEP